MDQQAIRSLVHESISGVSAGVIASTITYPLDLVKTRLQTDLSSDHHSVTSMLIDIVLQQGVRGLFVGITSEYVKVFVQNSVYFSSYSLLKSCWISDRRLPPTAVELLAIGVLAGATTQLFVNPVSVIQTRQQTRHNIDNAQGFLSILTSLLVEEGPRSLYTGIIPALVLTINPSIQFMVFDKLKVWWVQKRAGRRSASEGECRLTPAELFIIGAIAKTIATVITYPYIMAKTRIQSSSQRMGVLALLLHIVRNKGILATYKGMQTQIMKSVLSTALMFMFRDSIENYTKRALSTVMKSDV